MSAKQFNCEYCGAGAAAVPMPEPSMLSPETIDGYQHVYPMWNEVTMQQYGAACCAAGEAAGYARGLRELLDCRTCRNYTRDGCIQTAQCADGDGYRRATPIRFWSAALRGEVKR